MTGTWDASSDILCDAIDALGDGVTVYDAQDRLLYLNESARFLMVGDRSLTLRPGQSFESVLRATVASGAVPGVTAAEVDDWVALRLDLHLNPGTPQVEQRSGRWIRFRTQRLPAGGAIDILSDVTELHEAREEARAAEKRLQEIVDGMPAMVFVKDTDGRYLLSNSQADRLWKLERGHIIGKTDHDVFPVEHADAFVESDRQAYAAPGPYHFNYESVHKGEAKHTRVTKFPLRDAAGTPYALCAIATDVTDIVRRDEAIAAREAMLTAILDNTDAMVMLRDMAGRYVLSNAAHDRFMGRAPGSLIGRTDREIHPPDLCESFEETDRRVLSGTEPLRYEVTYEAGGRPFFVMVSKFVLRDAGGEAQSIGVVASNVTEIKQREAELAESERRLQAILDNTSAPVMLKDPDGVFLLSNKAHDRLWLPEPETMVGRTEAEFHDAEALARFARSDRHILDTGESVPFIENHEQDGARRTFTGHKFPLYDDSGRPSSIGVVAAEVTQLKQREEELSRVNDRIGAALRYASRIQSGMLPSVDRLTELLPDSFLIWEPRDVVGGDFYWAHPVRSGTYVMVGDATGHGVPGAFMTLIACAVLDRRLRTMDTPAPARLLAAMHRDIRAMLGAGKAEHLVDDGVELGVAFLDPRGGRVVFAGARFDLLHASGGRVETIRGDRRGIGFRDPPGDMRFTDRTVTARPGDAFYLATDGLPDQVGGPRGIGFGRRRLREFVLRNAGRPLREQGAALLDDLTTYQGDHRRRDDLTVLGFGFKRHKED